MRATTAATAATTDDAPLVLASVLGATALGLTGCTGSSSEPSPSPTRAATVTQAPAVDPAATRALERAIRRTQALHSYAFAAVTTIAAAQRTRITVTGRLVRGEGLTYRLHTAKRRTEVVRLRHHTYVRRLHGRWHELVHPRSVVNPTATLVAVLRGTRAIDRTELSDGRARIRGDVTPAAAKRAGIPTGAGPVMVTVTLDAAGRVVSLAVNAMTTAGTTEVAVHVRSAYSRFGHVRAVRRPF